MTTPTQLPFPGNWTLVEASDTGAWSLGRLWIDRTMRRLCMKIEPQHANLFGVMHGGAMATFADAQCAAVRHYTGDAEDHTPTISLSIDYIAPAPVGSWLLAEVVLQRTTRSMMFTQATMTIDGVIVARSSAIYKNFAGKDTR